MMVEYTLSEEILKAFDKLACIDVRLTAFSEIMSGTFDENKNIPHPKCGDNIILSALIRKNIGIFSTSLLKSISDKKAIIKNIIILIFYFERDSVVPKIRIIEQKYIREFNVDSFISKDSEIVATVYYVAFSNSPDSYWVIFKDTESGAIIRPNDIIIKSIVDKKCY
jgi:hypothetical protein